MKIGIIICDRYKNCAGGKCFRAMRNREGAFDIYSKDKPLEIVGYTSCGGCPGGNIEYAPEEIKKWCRSYPSGNGLCCWVSSLSIYILF
ncbi:CGGC domain-containing protein [Desulfovulcanus sp.]